jgi:hypothetical protein
MVPQPFYIYNSLASISVGFIYWERIHKANLVDNDESPESPVVEEAVRAFPYHNNLQLVLVGKPCCCSEVFYALGSCEKSCRTSDPKAAVCTERNVRLDVESSASTTPTPDPTRTQSSNDDEAVTL